MRVQMFPLYIMSHSVLMVDIGSSLHQPLNCLCVSILRGYSQGNRVGRVLREGMKRRGKGSVYKVRAMYSVHVYIVQISVYTYE